MVRAVVAQVAADELVLVDELSRVDDKAAVRLLRHRRRREPSLGYGLAEVATLVTPVVWLSLSEAARRIGASAGDGAAAGGRALFRKLLRRKAPPAVIAKPTAEQRAMIHRIVLDAGVTRGLSQQRAATIADAVYTQLELAWKPPGTDGTGK